MHFLLWVCSQQPEVPWRDVVKNIEKWGKTIMNQPHKLPQKLHLQLLHLDLVVVIVLVLVEVLVQGR